MPSTRAKSILVTSLLALALGDLTGQAKVPREDWRAWKNAPPAWATPSDIEAAKYLKNIQMRVIGCTPATSDPSGNYRYEWQVRFARAAQAEGDIDTPEEVERLRKIWQRFEERGLFDCNSLQFDVSNGSLVKCAAINSNDAFIDFVAKHKLGLTRVDESDGKTVLDYIQYHITRTQGGEIAKHLEIYYRQLREAGAKHRSELPETAALNSET